MFAKHSRCLRFISLLIPLFLVIMGMRVPDFSRPQKPKPMRRAILAKTTAHTVLQSVVKAAEYPCCLATLPTVVFHVTEDYSPVVPPVYSPAPLFTLSPFPPRAPPTSLHRA